MALIHGKNDLNYNKINLYTIDSFINYQYKGKGNTALQYCCIYNNLYVIKYFLENNTVDKKYLIGTGSIYYCIRHDNIKILKYLIKKYKMSRYYIFGKYNLEYGYFAEYNLLILYYFPSVKIFKFLINKFNIPIDIILRMRYTDSCSGAKKYFNENKLNNIDYILFNKINIFNFLINKYYKLINYKDMIDIIQKIIFYHSYINKLNTIKYVIKLFNITKHDILLLMDNDGPYYNDDMTILKRIKNINVLKYLVTYFKFTSYDINKYLFKCHRIQLEIILNKYNYNFIFNKIYWC